MGGGSDTTPPGDTTPPKEELGEDGKPVPFHKHPRWVELQEGRKEDKETIKNLTTDLEALKKGRPTPEEVESIFAKHASKLQKLDPKTWTEFLDTVYPLIKSQLFEDMDTRTKKLTGKQEKAIEDADKKIDEQFKQLKDQGVELSKEDIKEIIEIGLEYGQDVLGAYSIFKKVREASEGGEATAKRKARSRTTAPLSPRGKGSKTKLYADTKRRSLDDIVTDAHEVYEQK